MAEILSSNWLSFIQALLAIIGTWLLAFGLKSIKETGMFDTSNPQPLSPRFWIGLILITLSLLPPLVSPFANTPDASQQVTPKTETLQKIP